VVVVRIGGVLRAIMRAINIAGIRLRVSPSPVHVLAPIVTSATTTNTTTVLTGITTYVIATGAFVILVPI